MADAGQNIKSHEPLYGCISHLFLQSGVEKDGVRWEDIRVCETLLKNKFVPGLGESRKIRVGGIVEVMRFVMASNVARFHFISASFQLAGSAG